MGSHEEVFHDGDGHLLIDQEEKDKVLDHATVPYLPGMRDELLGLEGSDKRISDTLVDSVAHAPEESTSQRNALPPVSSVISEEAIKRSSAPPPVAALPFGSWDGPEDDLSDHDQPRSPRRASLAPTPSMMPTIRAATSARRRAGIMAIAVVILLLTGGVVLGLTGVPNRILGGSEEESRADPMVLVDGTQTASIGGGGAASDGHDHNGGSGSQNGSESSGAAEEGAEGLGMTGEHGSDQDISGDGIGGENGRRLRGSGQFGERSTDGRGRRVARGDPLDAQQIRVTVGRNSRTIRSCHEREMRRTGMPISQRVNVRIRVARSGVVQSVDISGGMVAGTPLSACIEQAVRHWRFPEATGETVFETPFVLSPRHN